MHRVTDWHDTPDAGLSWQDAQALLLRHVTPATPLWQHSVASAAVMAAATDAVARSPQAWAIAGFVHDADWPLTADDPSRHGSLTAQWLAQLDAHPAIIRAVLSHNDELLPPAPRSTPFEHLLAAAETSTGLIAAAAKVTPDRHVRSLSLASLTKRFHAPSFARSVNRMIIRECASAGFEVEEFLALALAAVQRVGDEPSLLPGYDDATF